MCITYLNDLPQSHSPLKMSYSTEDPVMLREELSEWTQRAADKAHVRRDSGEMTKVISTGYLLGTLCR